MPPIFGILNTSLQPIDPEMIRRMKEAAVYVKPREIFSKESSGAFMAAAVVKENPLVPGRDTIIVDGEWVLVADVSLYKRNEGQGTRDKRQGTRDKEREGCECWGRKSDSEYIMEMWKKWGKDCVKHLYGDFAFVIFNTRTGDIFCSRDHLGVRPLFYTFQNGLFIFASELRLLASALPFKPAVREEYLLDTLINEITAKHLAPFETCYRLKPAHTIHISHGTVKELEYWQADPGKTIRYKTEQEYIALLQEKLVLAVNMRCQYVSSLGTELSGGLDSSAITSIAAQYLIQQNEKLLSFSNLYPDDSNIEFKDEREFIKAMQAFIPFNWYGIDRSSIDLGETLNYAVKVQGIYIQQDFSIFNKTLYETVGKRDVQVLLSGFGGDELASARTLVPWNEYIRTKEWQIIINEIFHQGITVRSLLKPFLIVVRYLKAGMSRQQYTSGVFTKELLDGRFANLPLQPDYATKHLLRKRLGDSYKKLKRRTLSQRQFDRIRMDHVPQRMEYCYAAAAQYGFEYRYPLWDKDLVETALAFPPWLKHHHGINRYMFRQAIKSFVPEKIWDRNDKAGATIPHMFHSLAMDREPLFNVINDASGSVSLNEIIDFSKFPGWYERLVQRDPKELNYLMHGAFYSYLMMMIYEEKRISSPPPAPSKGGHRSA